MEITAKHVLKMTWICCISWILLHFLLYLPLPKLVFCFSRSRIAQFSLWSAGFSTFLEHLIKDFLYLSTISFLISSKLISPYIQHEKSSGLIWHPLKTVSGRLQLNLYFHPPIGTWLGCSKPHEQSCKGEISWRQELFNITLYHIQTHSWLKEEKRQITIK